MYRGGQRNGEPDGPTEDDVGSRRYRAAVTVSEAQAPGVMYSK